MQEYDIAKALMIVPDSQKQGMISENLRGDSYWVRSIALPSNRFVENQATLRALRNEMWNA